MSITILLFAGVIGMLLLSVSVIVFYLIYTRRLLAQQQQISQLETDYQRELLNSTLEAQESERRRIAHDLHDSVGSLLSATKLFVGQLKQETPETEYRDLKEETKVIIDETIRNIRNITRNLLPTSLEKFGLIPAIRGIIKRINDLGTIEVSFKYDRERRFSPPIETAIFRVLQELMNNSLTHSGCSHIHIDLSNDEQFLLVQYADDGKGFHPHQFLEQSAPAHGLGLKSIQSRINAIHGVVHFHSAPNAGMAVRIQVNL